MGPPDPVLGANEVFAQDTHPQKVNLTIGAYRDENGLPWVLPSVRLAEHRLLHTQGCCAHELLPTRGSRRFLSLSQEVAFGEEFAGIKDKRVSSVQSLSGTGALRIAMEFLREWYPSASVSKVWAPHPTWPTHHSIAKGAHFDSGSYRYYDYGRKRFNVEWMLSDLEAIPDCQIVLLHACAHNPTGSDPSP